MNIHVMNEKTYRNYRDKIESSVFGTSQKEMDDAAEMERKLAIEAGDFIIHNGTQIPFIKVIVDGAWSKRSYKNERYDALSGFATIIGWRTGRVLYCGKRNKYCSVCAAASKNQKDPTPHKCYKNYARNEPSTSMETDIIVEGFKISVESNGLIYRSFVGDGDSSVHQSIVNNNPYKDYNIEVEKVECKNHLFHNFCNHIANASEIKIPASTILNVTVIRRTVKESAKKMRIYVEKNVESIKKKTDDRDLQIEQLRNLLTIMPKHFFGDHTKCTEKIINGCANIKENITASLETVGIYPIIIQIVSRLSKHAGSLLDNLTTNKVEGLNSIANKTLGGRRINYSQRGSFNLRVSIAAIQADSQEVGTKIHQFMGLEVPAEVTKLEASKKAQVLRTEKSRQNKGRTFRKFYGTDKFYGKVQEEDMPLYEYNHKEEEHLQKLKNRQKNRDEIMNETIDQSESANWHQYRRDIITASNFGAVCRRRATTSCSALVIKIVYPKVLNISSLQFGREFEKTALKDLVTVLKIKPQEIKSCGLFIDEKIEYLGATPDGLIGDDYAVEVKCLESIKHLSPDEALDLKKQCMTKIFDPITGQLKKTHDYYYQVQGQLHITNRKFCYFSVWTPKGIKYELIERDDQFWETKMEPFLTRFYKECVLPEIIDSRKNRNMKIREPDFILEAQKKAEEAKKNPGIQKDSTPNEEIEDDSFEETTSKFIKKLLLDIAKSENLEEIEEIWLQEREIIDEVCDQIEDSVQNFITNGFSYPVFSRNLSTYRFKTTEFSNNVIHEVNNDFSIVNVEPDGNCMFRSIADVVLNDENKYMDIKVFLINNILSNKTRYEPIIYYSGIPVSDKENNLLLFPTVDDFIRMVAQDGKWGDHGSLYILCVALRLNLIIFGVDPSTHNFIDIRKYSPGETQSEIPITMINELGKHFMAAHMTTSCHKFNSDMWNDKKITIITVDKLLSHFSDKFDKQNKKSRLLTSQICLGSNSVLKQIFKILTEIQKSKSLESIEEIVNNNRKFIEQVRSYMQDEVFEFGCNLVKGHDKDIKDLTIFPEECLNFFDIHNVNPDGNCLYRSVAKLLFNNEDRYPEVKLLCVSHILEYKEYYKVLCIKKIIADDTSPNLTFDEFIKIVAGLKIWANEGSLIAISEALKLKLLTITVENSKITVITWSGPKKVKSSKFITVINNANTHYYAGRCKNDNYNVNNIVNNFGQNISWTYYDLLKLYETFR